MKKLKLVALGCGARTRTYVSLARQHLPDHFDVVAAADPRPERVRQVRACAHDPKGFLSFGDYRDLLAREKLGEIAIIGTQDADHLEPALAAMEKGYDLLLEKPVATTAQDVLTVAAAARRLGRRVMVCHVLRFAPLYQAVKAVVESGELGEIRTVNATEGVGPWHFAHSYVRGHWNDSNRASPLILAKSCHDLDILSWLMGDECVSVSSVGDLSHFRSANFPAGAPGRCTDGCPHAATCHYNAEHYLDRERRWLSLVWSGDTDVATAGEEEIRRWLALSPWGRCAYQCDNNQPDHQTAQFQFARGQTATFTVTAFASGRTLEIYGTRGMLRAGTNVEVVDHATGRSRVIQTASDAVTAEGYDEHGGGDFGLVSNLYDQMTGADPGAMTTGIDRAVPSHLMAFAAEESRTSGQTVLMSQFFIGTIPSTTAPSSDPV